MFAIVAPGRLVQPVEAISETAFSATISDAQSLNHLCIFLTGAVPFPEGYGCSIHLEVPGTSGWRLIGGLSNAKPSAIFRLRGTFIASQASASAFTSSSSSSDLHATLGILCEPFASVEAQLASLQSTLSSAPSTSTELVLARPPPDPVTLAQRIAQNCFSYVGGFAVPAPDGSGSSWIEMGVIEKWYRSMETKIRNGGIGFLQQSD